MQQKRSSRFGCIYSTKIGFLLANRGDGTKVAVYAACPAPSFISVHTAVYELFPSSNHHVVCKLDQGTSVGNFESEQSIS